MKNAKRKMAALLAVILAMTSMPVAAAENVATAGTDTTVGEAQIITASGQLGDKPAEMEARSAEEIIEALYAKITEEDLAELVNLAGDAFADTEAPEGATDAEEYGRMLTLVRKEAEVYLAEVLEKVKEEYTELGQEEVYQAVFNGLCEKIVDAIKGLYGMEEPSVMSLQPLEEKEITTDLTGLTPVELTQVPFSRIFEGEDMTGVDKIAYVYHYSDYEWSDRYSDDYVVTDYQGYADLSERVSSSVGSYTPWLMIPSGDQLNGTAIRYIVWATRTRADKWLVPTVYSQDEMGNRTEAELYSYDYSDIGYSTDSNGNRSISRYMSVDLSADKVPYEQQIYLKFDLNKEIYGESENRSSIKVYEGKYTTAEAASAGNDITDKILGDVDMTQRDAGYSISGYYSVHWITIVSFDADGNVTGCLPLYFRVGRRSTTGTTTVESKYVGPGNFFQKTDSGRISVLYSTQKRGDDNDQTRIYRLYEGYPANESYYLSLEYYVNGRAENSAVTAAYMGQYDSIAGAQSAGAEDIRESLFGTDYDTEGYAADYSQGVHFSIFIGADGEGQEVYHYLAQTEESIIPQNAGNSGADVRFTGLVDKDGNSIKCYIVKPKDDSYAEGSYPTIMVEEDVDLTYVAPVFYTTSTGVNLYAAGSNIPEESEKSYHDFSKGAVHYTTASENGENQKNVWLTVKTEGSGETIYNLYTNSLADQEAGTKVENGIIYSKREVILEAANDGHDIFLANMGSKDIPKLSVELESDVLEIDEYWTLNGNHDLSAFAGVADETKYGELANMAKVRLKKKSDVISGTEIEGTLTVKTEGNVIMVLELVGVAGVPVIVTEDIPEAVKYVPYGTMIQNSNKYSKTKVRYALESGELPDGMEMRANGELYGVPKEVGTFNFWVQMVSTNPYVNTSKSFTLVVKENTDENVDASTDPGYNVTQRIPTVAIGTTDSKTFVSQGVLNEFVDVFLDGEKLVKDVDYSAESGSTRLTISSQTLTKANEVGTHTLGVEFRTSEENTLMKAAQNFDVVSAGTIVDEGNSGDGDSNNGSGNPDSDNENSGNNGNSGGGNSNSGDKNSNSSSGNPGSANSNSDNSGSSDGSDSNSNSPGSTSGNPNQFTANTIATQGTAGNEAIRTMIYTIEPGDTLSKIAVKYYGNASLWRKIYEDNRDVITNPNRIRVGMKLKLFLANVTTETTEAGNIAANATGQYTIRSGDSLWKIARAMYGQGGQWRRIYEANRNVIPDSLILRVGQVITIP